MSHWKVIFKLQDKNSIKASNQNTYRRKLIELSLDSLRSEFEEMEIECQIFYEYNFCQKVPENKSSYSYSIKRIYFKRSSEIFHLTKFVLKFIFIAYWNRMTFSPMQYLWNETCSFTHLFRCFKGGGGAWSVCFLTLVITSLSKEAPCCLSNKMLLYREMA